MAAKLTSLHMCGRTCYIVPSAELAVSLAIAASTTDCAVLQDLTLLLGKLEEVLHRHQLLPSRMPGRRQIHQPWQLRQTPSSVLQPLWGF